MADTNMLTDALRTADACITAALVLAQFRPTELDAMLILLDGIERQAAAARTALGAATDTEGGEA
ncbi:hypothetical protein MX652_06350 [Thauera aromatica]|nr:hypothetical protein [Thauera aromatica]MCK2126306.1 hypothetical protein [Thauera aromatica]